jgi:hypothetical protein
MANAAGSVAAAERPIAAVALPVNVTPGQDVSLNAAASAAACGRTVASYAWAYVAPATNPPAITGANTSAATVIAPTSGSQVVRVTVTDDLGRTDSADVTVTSNTATTQAPASAGVLACAVPVTSGPTPGSPANPTPTPTPRPTPAAPRREGGGSLGLLTLFGLLGAAGLSIGRRREVRFFRCNC